MSLKTINLPQRYNYLAIFLTLDCNLRCDYCINCHGGINGHRKKEVDGREWLKGLNRLVSRPDLPVTMQGGEPSVHRSFIYIINNLKEDLNIDILTNLCFDVDNFIKQVDPSRLRREAPYPSIRVSYHPGYMDFDSLIKKVLKMQKAGFSIGIFGVLHPRTKDHILETRKKCIDLGIDFRTKEFLGEFKGRLYGTYLYPGSVNGEKNKKCLCRTSELIVGPDCNVYGCHHDLYSDSPPVGNLLDPDFQIRDTFRECYKFGSCNPCDVKVKTNRFQIFGHTSVEIKDIREIKD
ncbi:MAG: radical SAM protein [Candidatus Omnitrophica bacterium]|nr:radical SAM protein [Candidatus Omnitrophota bacterium]MBD3269058.1 radical SAM protein [Candidatus Omnitrophota bacterium]